MGPGVASVACRMANKIKDLDYAFPYSLPLKGLSYGYGFNPRRIALMDVADSLTKLLRRCGHYPKFGGLECVKRAIEDLRAKGLIPLDRLPFCPNEMKESNRP